VPEWTADGEEVFSLPEAAQILGVSESYMRRLDNNNGEDHLVRMRRNHRGGAIYSAEELRVMDRMGIGRRRGRLRFLPDAMEEMNVSSFGTYGVVRPRPLRTYRKPP